MVTPLNPPLQPRRGNTLKVLLICRISTAHQDVAAWRTRRHSYDVTLRITTRGKWISALLPVKEAATSSTRANCLRRLRLIESRELDADLGEDLSRFCRQHFAITLCEIAQDADTRVITIHDSIDTGRDDWHLHATFGAMKGEAYNKETWKRSAARYGIDSNKEVSFRPPCMGTKNPPVARAIWNSKRIRSRKPIYDEMFRRSRKSSQLHRGRGLVA